MATLEQIIDEARALSPGEKHKLREALDRELGPLARRISTRRNGRLLTV